MLWVNVLEALDELVESAWVDAAFLGQEGLVLVFNEVEGRRMVDGV